MGDRVKVLDHGYIELVESWGSDERIIEAARMSTGKGFQGWGPKHAKDCKSGSYMLAGGDYVDPATCGCATTSGDEKLLRYLYTHKHSTPFEMGGMVIEVQAPIFVFREWHRHRTMSYSELSARYTPLPNVNYVPTVERLMMSSGANKQAQGVDSKLLDKDSAESAIGGIEHAYAQSENEYLDQLELGVPKELARLVLPVGRYSRMRASANLRNWLAFITLRSSPNAQWEIRQYSDAVLGVVGKLFPRTYELFMEEFNGQG